MFPYRSAPNIHFELSQRRKEKINVCECRISPIVNGSILYIVNGSLFYDNNVHTLQCFNSLYFIILVLKIDFKLLLLAYFYYFTQLLQN